MPDSALMSQVSSRELATSTARVMADVVRLLVHRPDRVDVKIRGDGSNLTLLLRVAPDDVGKLVGKQGRTARSLRIVLSSLASKTGVQFQLNIHAEER